MKTKTRTTRRRRPADRAFDRMAEAIGAYLATAGWRVVVVGSPRVEHPLGERTFNFNVVVPITARPPDGEAPSR